MTNKELWTLVLTVLLALSGYLVTYLNNIWLAQRKERLDRVNRQLSEFYGPLFSLSQASNTAWQAFRNKYRPKGAYFGEDIPPTEEELEAWRLWMKTVFMPNNQRMYETILQKSDLLIEPEMPACLLYFCAHVTAYQTVLKRWENNDFSEYTSLVEYPTAELVEYARKSFIALKAEQKRLIGQKQSPNF